MNRGFGIVKYPAVSNGASNLKRPKGRGIRPSRQSSRSCKHDFDSLHAGITALLVFSIAFCMRGTVLCKERSSYAQENERYAALEADYLARTKGILEDAGYRNSGVTITWTREDGGPRSYLVKIHHREIECLDGDELEELTERLCGGELSGEAKAFRIVYI